MNRAIILAGGPGTRLRPYTTVLPKPLMPIGDRPVLDIAVRQLSRYGFDRLTVATGYLAELVETFLNSGKQYGISIDFYRETEPLGTAGSLAFIDDLTDDFLVMNGDLLTDIDYSVLIKEHRESGAAATIATTNREIEVSLGVMHFDNSNDVNQITGYSEKPKYQYKASMGVYCFSPEVINYIKQGEHLDFPDLILRLLAGKEFVRGHIFDGYWLDIGRHDDYEQALDEFDSIRDKLLGSSDT